ncbi:MAG: ABC transporter ATP-binding protein, partial [Candidatus Eremiobacteraeota bacterium]|nr:ABC transporter ATP-binding protein [Candidatus Eremiobacteraeota bacterium]
AMGTAIVVTTHHLEEAEHCERICMLSAGKIVAEGSPSQLKAREPGTVYELDLAQPERGLDAIERVIPAWRVSLFGTRVHAVLEQPERELPAVRTPLESEGISLKSAEPIQPSLEDVFIGLVHGSRT